MSTNRDSSVGHLLYFQMRGRRINPCQKKKTTKISYLFSWMGVFFVFLFVPLMGLSVELSLIVALHLVWCNSETCVLLPLAKGKRYCVVSWYEESYIMKSKAVIRARASKKYIALFNLPLEAPILSTIVITKPISFCKNEREREQLLKSVHYIWFLPLKLCWSTLDFLPTRLTNLRGSIWRSGSMNISTFLNHFMHNRVIRNWRENHLVKSLCTHNFLSPYCYLALVGMAHVEAVTLSQRHMSLFPFCQNKQVFLLSKFREKPTR